MQEKIKGYLIDVKKDVDCELEKILSNNDILIDALYKSSSYSAAGGKRIRAVFTMLIGQLFQVEFSKLLSSACSIELIHAASLIMDDLPYMENSQLRRGKPANHVVFGQDVALLASVGLLSKAQEIILSDETIDVDLRLKIAQYLADSFGFNGLAAGQFVDIKLKHKDIDFSIIEYITDKKAAALFSTAGRIAAAIGGANKEQVKAVEAFARNIGFAFQIIDDFLELAENEKKQGKTPENDKLNFVKVIGKEKAKDYLNEYKTKAENELAIFGDAAIELKTFNQYLLKRI
jgi:geranylgeranyl diphosphate synthase type II